MKRNRGLKTQQGMGVERGRSRGLGVSRGKDNKDKQARMMMG